jgi:hypothetical protein
MHPHNLHREKIKMTYQRIQRSKNPAHFVLDLHSFMNQICSNESFNKVIDLLQEQYTKDTTALKSLELQTLKEIQKFYRKIQKYLKTNNVQHPLVQEALKEYKKYEKQHIQCTQSPILECFRILNHTLNLLMSYQVPDTNSFIQQHTIIDTHLNYHTLRENSSTQRQQLFKSINEFMHENKIINPKIAQLLANYHLPKENNTEQKIASHQYMVLMNSLIELSQHVQHTAHHLEFVMQHAQLNEMGAIIQTTYAPSMEKYLQEIARLERIQESRPWHNMHKLLYFYSLYANDEQMINTAFSHNNIFHGLFLKTEFNQIKALIDSADAKITVDRLNAYKKDTQVIWQFLLPAITETKNIAQMLQKTQAEQCQRALQNNEVDHFISILKSIVASIPYQIRPKDESAFHIILHLVTGGNSEECTSNGRIDLVYKTATHIYIFELKFRKNAQLAMHQIHKNGYFQKFMSSGKKIILIGLSINIKGEIDYIVEELDV